MSIDVEIVLCEDGRTILAEAFEGDRSLGMASWAPPSLTDAEVSAMASDPTVSRNIAGALTNARKQVRTVHGRAMTEAEERGIIAAALEWSTPGYQPMPALRPEAAA